MLNAICQICTDPFDLDQAVAAMPCGHTFHDECLIRWLISTRNCPSCRKPLKKTQHPIHKLFFSSDLNNSQLPAQSHSSKDAALLEANRKLKSQVEALQAAISKLKSECQAMEDNNAAVTCSLNEKDSEIHKLKRIQTKMKEKIRGFNSNEEEADKLRQKLRHLEHVEIIVNGVEADVKRMLEDNAGYTPQQLTYLVLLRQQLDSSKQTNEKLKRSLADLREKLIRTERVSSEGKNEIDMLKLELSQAEARNVSLKRKCDTLIKAMNSPKGVASSLASRFIHQSPAPDTVTPLSTPATAAGAVNTSLDLFNETDQNDIKLALDFEEEENSRKKPKFVSSKAMLTQEHELNNAATLSPTILTTIKPKSTLRLKTKGRDQGKPGVKPLGTISSNLPPADSTFTRNLTSSGSNFRKGFDGLGGQTQAFNRTKSAMQFNIFKKPPVKANKKEKTLTNQTSLEDFILLD